MQGLCGQPGARSPAPCLETAGTRRFLRPGTQARPSSSRFALPAVGSAHSSGTAGAGKGLRVGGGKGPGWQGWEGAQGRRREGAWLAGAQQPAELHPTLQGPSWGFRQPNGSASAAVWEHGARGEAPPALRHHQALAGGCCSRQRGSRSCVIWGWEEALPAGSTLPREIRGTWPPTALARQESRLPYVQSWCQKRRSHRQQATHPLPHTFPAFSLLLASRRNQLTFFTTRKQSNNLFSCFGSSSSSPAPPSPPARDAVSTPKA